MSLSPADVKDLLTLGLLSPLQDTDAIPVERSGPPLQMTPLQALRAYIAASQGSVRFYGGLQGRPAAGQVLFEILMEGDEVFDAGLPASLLACDTAPTGTVSLAMSVNGAPVGSGGINAAATAGTFSFAAGYNAQAGDKLKFTAPASQDATLSGLAYTFVFRRSG